MQGIDETENQMQKQTQKGEEPTRKEVETEETKETVGRSQKAGEELKSKKNTAMRKKGGNEPDKISKKQVFSFRAMLTDIAIWKAYAIASGKTMEDICNDAMYEYIKKHKLAGVEQAIFDAIKARDSTGSE